MDLQETAKKLIKMADQIEKDASDKSIFICSECNHTASLTDINDRRTKLAGDQYEVKPVTINDKVFCPVPECKGTMSYIATDESQNFYVEDKDAAKEDDPAGSIEDLLGDAAKPTPTEEEPPKPPKKPKAPKLEEPGADLGAEPPALEAPTPEPPALEAPAPEDKTDDLNVDNLFEDVETQNENMKADKAEQAETTQKARKERTDEKNRIEQEHEDGLGIPAAKEPLGDPTIKTEPSPESVKDQPKEKEDIFDVGKPKKPKKPKPEDIIKKDVPKFKSKEASDRYMAASSRYSV